MSDRLKYWISLDLQNGRVASINATVRPLICIFNFLTRLVPQKIHHAFPDKTKYETNCQYFWTSSWKCCVSSSNASHLDEYLFLDKFYKYSLLRQRSCVWSYSVYLSVSLRFSFRRVYISDVTREHSFPSPHSQFKYLMSRHGRLEGNLFVWPSRGFSSRWPL